MLQLNFLQGTGEMAERIRAFDWASTPLGPPDGWPTSLRAILGVLLSSRHPMFLWWGPELIQFYNDGYRPSLGADRHPAGLGAKGREFWSEIWDFIGPQIDGVMNRGQSTWNEDHLVPILRNRRIEEVYWTYGYSPVYDDDGGVGGTLVVVQETTSRVVGERRLQMLRVLATRAAATRTVSEAWSTALDCFRLNPSDLPWAGLYARSDGGAVSFVGETTPSAIGARALELFPVEAAMREGRPILVEDWPAGVDRMQGSVWPEPISSAWVVPVPRPGSSNPYGALVAGLSPRLGATPEYLDFLRLTADHVAAAVTNAGVSEFEQRRINALAEIDRAKTVFFSEVSHEFRTPLTLMLGPTADALALPEPRLDGDDLVTVHRNALRLLKLVNSLLDFARIEAGRAEAERRPTDLAALTREVAGAFERAMTQAGLTFEVDCQALPRPVLVDRDKWEKIVLNLLSNAFKFTLEGRVRLSLRAADDTVELVVADSGVGIPDDELPNLFQRFRRIQTRRARTQEGSGIGLALVHEFVKLHGGTVTVASEVNRGTTFTVRLPFGDLGSGEAADVELPAGSTELVSAPYVEEALRWIPPAPGVIEPRTRPASSEPAPSVESRILVVDDNADMRDYLSRILADRWSVEAVGDGEAALAAVGRSRPALVLADVMMPGLDGFGMLAAIRANPAWADLPVILLSAREGEGARVAGAEAGADDYMVKPFSAVELRARVESLLLRSRVRSVEAAHHRRLEELFRHAPVSIAVLRGPEHVFAFVNEPYAELISHRPVLGLPVREAVPELEGQGIYELLDTVYSTGQPHREESMRVVFKRGPEQQLSEGYFKFVYQPMHRDDGTVQGIVVVATEVTELANARREAERANRSKDEFIAMLGHELRNPLAPIQTALHLMELRGRDEGRDERAVIQRQVAHLSTLVDDLLDISRITTGNIELNHARVELAEIVASSIEMTSPALEQRRISMEVRVPPDGLAVRGDAKRLAQVVSNLLGNAAKFSERGGRVDVRGEVDGEWLVLTVSDQGRGIDAEMLPRIFDMFTQERQALDRSRGGLGLGLTIVRKIVEMHGGTVSADSAGRGRGATFAVRLPRMTGDDVASVETPGVVDAAGEPAGRRILVVDDNHDAAEMLERWLRTLGYLAEAAHDGPSALAVAAEFDPHVVLIDIGLPVMDGYELGARLRAAGGAAPPRLIAISGYGQDSDRAASAAAGFEAHLVKPVNLHHLRELLAADTPESE